ncbi:MAG TPA: hypothetical protein VE954_41505 [Oligoflexus sp.]|uniref:hypothetical protein n=1 Tax=Oligoflexus sp. TaxID=1971216 RepID=UPI002D314E8C|nr:hypothetical protein [Oligoflexus sp.]HYX39619.1 hypothetical protein [Oligoflexus sp.]
MMRAFYLAMILALGSASAEAYTANKVAFEFMQNGQYRITVNYTDAELKEFRESYVLFNKKKEAESFYWKLVRGADFYPEDPKLVRFIPPKTKPTPW